MNSLTVAPTQWAKFKDIEDVEPVNDADYECLAEVRDVLRKHGKCERFGVALLHKHFDVAEGEVLVETTDKASRTLMVRPMKSDDTGPTIETIWELGDGDTLRPMMGCRQYCGKDVQGNHNSFHQQT